MTDGTGRKLSIPLDFLPAGQFEANIYRDDAAAPESPAKVIHEKRTVASADTITVIMAPAGGHVIHLAPVPAKDGRSTIEGK
jgi:alpha-glucosidase